MKPWKFLQWLLLPLAVVASIYWGGWYSYILPVTCFIIRPLYSLSRGREEIRVTCPETPASAAPYRFIALSFVPVLLGVTIFSAYAASHTGSDTIEFTGLALSAGTMNGIIGFTLAHEFIHRHTLPDRLAGHLLLLQNNYLHYSIEHIGGHHVYACTPKDPHTARLNESFYRFLPRAVLFTFINAWEIESKRLARNEHRLLSPNNRILLFIFLQLLLALTIILVAGWLAFLFLLVQSFVAITLLHITNYLQHYGLLRKELEPGRYERVSPRHAWNSPDRKESLSLFHLENHADHHLHPHKSYEKLQKHGESPVQPAGYSGMLLLALIPPLWFRVMNKRLVSFTTKNA